MGLVTDTLRTLGLKAFTPSTLPHPTASGFAHYLPNEADYTRQVGDGGGTSIVTAVLNWMVRQFPEATLRVLQAESDGTKVPRSPHPLTDIIDKPNDYYDGDALFAGAIVSVVLDGNGYWVKVRNGATRVVELWYIPHFLIEPRGRSDGSSFIDYYEYTIAGRRYELAPSEIVHFRFGTDPRNPRKGMSQLRGQLREIFTDEEAARFSAAMLVNTGVPGLVISPKSETSTVTETDADKVKAKVDQAVGQQNRGRTVVMSGATVVEQFGFSPEQMTLRDLRAIPEERVSAALGVPAAVVGLGTGLAQTKVGATMHELREMATEQSLVPTWRMFARHITRWLLPEFQAGQRGLTAEFDTSEVRVLQEDRQKLHERTRGDFDSGLIDGTVAQARLGYPVDEARRVYRVPINVTEVPAAPPRAPRGRRERGGKAAQPIELAFLRHIERSRPAVEASFAERLERAYGELGRRAVAEWERRKSAAPATVKANEELVDAIVRALAIGDFTDTTIGPAYSGSYEAAARLVMNGYTEALGIELAIGVQDTVAAQLIEEGGRRLGLLDITGDTRDALFRALAQARADGLGVDATGRLLREFVGAGPYSEAGAGYRARLIARTETRYATNISVGRTGQAAGFDRYRAYDNRTGFGDGDCVARDGQEFSYDEMMGEIAQEHPGGTLSFSPIPRTTG